MKTTTDQPVEAVEGLLMQSLIRNNDTIRNDRMIDINDSGEIKYRRKIEDMRQDLKSMERERNAMLDFSPTTIDSLLPAGKFDADDFVKRDIELGTKIRNLNILIDEVAVVRYKQLFGKDI